jgi:hypothetical protein
MIALLNRVRSAAAALAFLHALLAALLMPLCLPIALSPDKWNVLVLLPVLIGLATPVAATAAAARAWAAAPTRAPRLGPSSLPIFLFAFGAMWVVAWSLSPSSHQLLGAGFLSSLIAAMAALYQLDRPAAAG